MLPYANPIPLCVGGCWDRTQDCCNVCNGSIFVTVTIRIGRADEVLYERSYKSEIILNMTKSKNHTAIDLS